MSEIPEGLALMTKQCWCGGEAKLNVFTEEARCLESEYHDPLSDGRPEKIKRLYVAGPMSGYDNCNYPAFNAAAVQLEDAGFEVRNPASYGIVGSHYVDLIREDLRLLLDCHGVAVLEHWWESVGARNEVQVAGLLKMPVRNVDEWVYFSAKNR